MTDLEYIDSFVRFCRERTPDWEAALGDWYQQRSGKRDSTSYFRNHWPRFRSMIGMIDRHGAASQRMAELGSFYPYTTLRFIEAGRTIDLYDIMPRVIGAPPYSVDGVTLIDFNLCLDQWPQKTYELIVLSEVIEHLPINLREFERRVIALMELGGWLVVTYPMGGKNASGYEREFRDRDWTQPQEDHVREFTGETPGLFFTDLTLVEREDIVYPAYGRIRVCLYRR
jgi:hypothetical protein